MWHSWSGDNGESNLGRSGCGGAESGEDYVVWCEMCLYFISGVLSQRNNATLSSVGASFPSPLPELRRQPPLTLYHAISIQPTPSFTSILNLPTATVRHSSPVTRFFGRRSNHPYLHADSALPVVTSVYIGRLSTRVFHLSDNLHV